MKKFTLFFAGLLFSAVSFSQDLFFTNTNQSLLCLNPSFAGSNGYIRNQTVYRNQWPNISGPTYVTYMNTFDAFIKPINGGFAVTTIKDNQGNGTLVTNKFDVAYAQYISLADNKVKIVPSIQAGYLRLSLDHTKINFGDMINSRYSEFWNYYNRTNPWGGFTTPAQSKANFNVSSGLLVYYNKLTLGVSVFNINTPDIGLVGFYRLPIRTAVSASYNLPIDENTLLNINGVYFNQQKWQRFQATATIIYKKIFIGAGFGDSFAGYNSVGDLPYPNIALTTAGVHLKNMNIAYTYDIWFSKLSSGHLGSHELGISFNFKSKKDTLNKKFGPEFW